MSTSYQHGGIVGCKSDVGKAIWRARTKSFPDLSVFGKGRFEVGVVAVDGFKNTLHPIFIDGLIGFEYEEMETQRTPVDTMESTENDDIINQSSASMLPTMKQGGGVKPLWKNRSLTFCPLLPVATTVLAVSNSFKSQILCCSCKIY